MFIPKPFQSNLGIERYVPENYVFEYGLLQGDYSRVPEAKQSFVLVSACGTALAAITPEQDNPKLKHEFEQRCLTSISVRAPAELDAATHWVATLSAVFEDTLRTYGANRRRLIKEDSKPILKEDESASPKRYGHALKQAIQTLYFDQLANGDTLTHENMVSAYMPALLQGLGYPDYYISHDTEKGNFNKVVFTIPDFVRFEFYSAYKKGQNSCFERFDFKHGKYVRSVLSDLTREAFDQHIVDALHGYAVEQGYYSEKGNVFESLRAEMLEIPNTHKIPPQKNNTAVSLILPSEQDIMSFGFGQPPRPLRTPDTPEKPAVRTLRLI